MSTFPARGRLVGIDHGSVRIGIAISNIDQTIASPYENYTRRDELQNARYFKKLVEDERVAGFVVGLPVHLDGGESEQSTAARKFGDWLTQTTSVPVCYFDERFTSSQAEQILGDAQLTRKQRKKRLDMLAAQIILSAFLESEHRDTPPEGLDDE